MKKAGRIIVGQITLDEYIFGPKRREAKPVIWIQVEKAASLAQVQVERGGREVERREREREERNEIRREWEGKGRRRRSERKWEKRKEEEEWRMKLERRSFEMKVGFCNFVRLFSSLTLIEARSFLPHPLLTPSLHPVSSSWLGFLLSHHLVSILNDGYQQTVVKKLFFFFSFLLPLPN